MELLVPFVDRPVVSIGHSVWSVRFLGKACIHSGFRGVSLGLSITVMPAAFT